jgi:hypothetical protein
MTVHYMSKTIYSVLEKYDSMSVKTSKLSLTCEAYTVCQTHSFTYQSNIHASMRKKSISKSHLLYNWWQTKGQDTSRLHTLSVNSHFSYWTEKCWFLYFTFTRQWTYLSQFYKPTHPLIWYLRWLYSQESEQHVRFLRRFYFISGKNIPYFMC